jgi:hypothetical protein
VCPVWSPATSPAPSHQRQRRYPSDTTDSEWALIEQLLPPPASATPTVGIPRRTPAGRSWMPSATWSTTAACGERCRATSHHGARCTGSSPGGPPMAPSTVSTTPCVQRCAPAPAATRSPARRSSTPSRSVPPTPCPAPAAALTLARRSTAASGTSRWTPSGCCCWSWSPPPASKTVTPAGSCCGGCAPPTGRWATSGRTPATRAGWSPGRGHPAPAGRDRPQAPRARLPGTAPPLGRGAHLRVDQQPPAHRARLRAHYRALRGHGQVGHGCPHDPATRTPALPSQHPSPYPLRAA